MMPAFCPSFIETPFTEPATDWQVQPYAGMCTTGWQRVARLTVGCRLSHFAFGSNRLQLTYGNRNEPTTGVLLHDKYTTDPRDRKTRNVLCVQPMKQPTLPVLNCRTTVAADLSRPPRTAPLQRKWAPWFRPEQRGPTTMGRVHAVKGSDQPVSNKQTYRLKSTPCSA